MRRLDARALRLGLFLHAALVLAAGMPLARSAGFLDALGLLLLAGAIGGFVTARVVRDGIDAAHTAFVAGSVGGLIVASVLTVGIRTDAATGVFWRFHWFLATAGLPAWLVVDYGDFVVLAAGLLLGAAYSLAALAGGAVAVGDVFQIEGLDRSNDR